MVSIISVSVDDKQRDWLQQNKGSKDCGSSFLLRRAINVKMQEMGDMYFEDIKTMRKKVERVVQMDRSLRDFIEKRGLTDEFLAQEE